MRILYLLSLTFHSPLWPESRGGRTSRHASRAMRLITILLSLPPLPTILTQRRELSAFNENYIDSGNFLVNARTPLSPGAAPSPKMKYATKMHFGVSSFLPGHDNFLKLGFATAELSPCVLISSIETVEVCLLRVMLKKTKRRKKSKMTMTPWGLARGLGCERR